jgi:hypothetical protein
MRHHQHSQFHFRHALFALQGPDGYVEALMETARATGAKQAAAVHFSLSDRAGDRGPLDLPPLTTAPARYRHH